MGNSRKLLPPEVWRDKRRSWYNQSQDRRALDGSHNQSKPVWWELGPGRSHGEDTTQAGKEREQKYLRFFFLSPTFQLPPRMQPAGVSPLPPRTEQGQSKWSNIP